MADPDGKRRPSAERLAMRSEVCSWVQGFQGNHSAWFSGHTPRLNEERFALSFNLFPSRRGDFQSLSSREETEVCYMQAPG